MDVLVAVSGGVGWRAGFHDLYSGCATLTTMAARPANLRTALDIVACSRCRHSLLLVDMDSQATRSRRRINNEATHESVPQPGEQGPVKGSLRNWGFRGRLASPQPDHPTRTPRLVRAVARK